ncbi:MAG TPA: hypothetical protein VFI22_00705, partial [Thermomicrobiales bacterium]|nr:hypothetical protein [Thermomicrobiales bacterium]
MTWSRAAAAALFIALFGALAAMPPAAPRASLAQQGTPAPAAVEIGAGPVGDRAFALTGRALHQPDAARFYGYLTAAIGLTPAQLFTGAP